MKLEGIIQSGQSEVTGSVFILDPAQLRSYSGSGATWFDVSGNDRNATLNNTPVYDTANGGSFLLDGTNEWISMAYSGSATDNYTFSIWFKNDNYSETKYLLGRGRDGAGNGWSLQTNVTTAGLPQVGVVPTVPTTVGLGASGSVVLALNTWYYITGVWTSNTSIKLYVDGILQSTILTSGRTTLRSSTSGWWMGSVSTTNFTSGYNGIAQVYNRVLTDAEILQNYLAQRSRYKGPVVISGSVLHLDASDPNSYPGSGTLWRDLTPNSNTFELYNGASYNSDNGGSIAFDGTNDGVSGSNAAVYSITNTVSLEAWVYLTTSDGMIIGKGPSNGAADFYPGNYELQVNASNKLSFLYQTNNSPGSSTFEAYGTATGVFSLNTWTHILAAASTVGGVRTVTIYTNGIARTTTRAGSAGDIISTNNTEPVRIGRRKDGSLIAGRIAIVRIYNRTLTASEAIQNYNAEKTRFGL